MAAIQASMQTAQPSQQQPEAAEEEGRVAIEEEEEEEEESKEPTVSPAVVAAEAEARLPEEPAGPEGCRIGTCIADLYTFYQMDTV